MKGWAAVLAAIGGFSLSLLAGCASDPGSAAPPPGDPLRPAARPLYQRSFVTPGGREWDFTLGSDYHNYNER